jgi:hypothetical protein
MALPVLVPPMINPKDGSAHFDGGIDDNDPGVAARRHASNKGTVLTFSLNAGERKKIDQYGQDWTGLEWLLLRLLKE